MVAGESFRYFADENVLGVGKALAMLRRDVLHPGHRDIPEVPLGSVDSVWIPIVASKGLVVISRDKKMRTRPAERAAIMASGMRGIWITDSKNLTSWDLMTRLVRYWDQIESMITNLGGGPWMVALNSKGLTVTARADSSPFGS